jgi:dihydrofolate reductase
VIGLVWAQSAHRVIGRDGTLPWRLPEDMAHFRELTTGATVIMGRRTWESLPERFRPLPGRVNIVLTSSPDWAADGATVAHSLPDALAQVDGDAWVIGGASVYAAALPLAERLEVTEVNDEFDGDVFAPEIGASWQLADTDPADGWHESSTGLRYRFCRYAPAATA